ncbi:hypothetical protein ThidrDRAFT_4565 [Thiorhodococcus drewsii AZ1]|uniref:Uncharacterized protein n=1 Tax=Thiorhodococcus drewsii AZ1 TaxID=765913 RepID=G2E8F1_9GAMM|nr:hypothetical protein [Thiorhodococcus drewsii]EGV27619.1 hypothetical protein ThidrDRAFT_4565 [Thiorhodococcus drewsii AZ1]
MTWRLPRLNVQKPTFKYSNRKPSAPPAKAASSAKAATSAPPPAPPAPQQDSLRVAIQTAKSPEVGCELVNQYLEAVDASWRVQPREVALDPHRLLAIAKEYSQTALVPDLLDQNLTEHEVHARLALARNLKDRMHAGGLGDFYQDTLATMLRSPVDAICHAFMLRMEEGEPQIRSDHQATARGTAEALTPAWEVMAARKKRSVPIR